MSSINPNNIDGTYPIAGQDNDSQGFRDNFTNIKNNLAFAQAELSDLQTNAILKSALSGGVLSNDFNYALIEKPQIKSATESILDLGTYTTATPAPINWNEALFQFFTLGTTSASNTTISFDNWPTSELYAKLRLQVTVSNAAKTLTFDSTGVTYKGLDAIQGISGNTITFPATGVYLFELSTYDNGTTIVIQDLLRNNNSITSGVSASFDIFTAATATVNGNLTVAGAKVESGYQILQPTANVAIQANVGISRVIIAPSPAGGITSFFADVTLPNVKVDGTVIEISSNVAVNTLRILPNWNTSISPNSNLSLSAGSSVAYLYYSTENKWFKVQ